MPFTQSRPGCSKEDQLYPPVFLHICPLNSDLFVILIIYIALQNSRSSDSKSSQKPICNPTVNSQIQLWFRDSLIFQSLAALHFVQLHGAELFQNIYTLHCLQ